MPRPSSVRVVLTLTALSLTAACARDDMSLSEESPPEIQIEDYEVVLTGLPEESMQPIAEESLQVYRLEEDGAQSRAFLRRRAEGDIGTLLKLLQSRGYFEGEVAVSLSPEDAEEVTVTLDVVPGPVYTLEKHDFQLIDVLSDPPKLDPSELGSPVGRPAVAASIIGAEDSAVGLLQREGFAYAQFLGRDAVADPDLHEIEVTSSLRVGRAYTFGDVTFDDIAVVEDEYLRTYINWTPGETFSRAKLRAYQSSLSGTGLFQAVTAEAPAEPPEGDSVPITVTGEPRPPRTVAVGAYYDTSDGPSAQVSLTHRNLFGRNENGQVSLEAGTDHQILGFTFMKPQYLRDGQSLVGSLELRHEDIDAYTETGGTLEFGIQRQIDQVWNGGIGGLIEISRIKQDGETNNAQLFGVPAFISYDDTNDYLNPTEGIRFRIDGTPFAGQYAGAGTAFLVLDGRASTYVPLDSDHRYVLAGRTRLGSILAESVDRVPATRRLYSGGGGSVRGYGTDMVGPLDSSGDPTGGLSVVEVGAEFRARVYGDIGAVAFVDGGAVSTESYPDFGSEFLTAAGVGGRYYSPVGPIRFDIGVPLNPRPEDDSFQFYFSIGQAF